MEFTPDCRVLHTCATLQPQVRALIRHAARVFPTAASYDELGAPQAQGSGGAKSPGGNMINHDHHDDFGGLHRDLVATGAVMDRRHLFRIAAKLGAGVGALQMLGCGGSPTAASDTTTTSTTT